jgi:hypothetical protein
MHTPHTSSAVSEHQPTAWASYLFDLGHLIVLAPYGIARAIAMGHDGASFIVVYTVSGCAGVCALTARAPHLPLPPPSSRWPASTSAA